jgi:hypothetical protein
LVQQIKNRITTISFLIIIATIGFPFSSFTVDPVYADPLDAWCDISSTVCDTSWQYRLELVIDHTQVSDADTADFTNFPVMINVTGSTFTDNLGSDTLEDIRFLNKASTSLLDYEIEKFDQTDDELIAWVEIPTLDYNDDTTIYMYYNNAGSPTDQQNPTGVWDSNYVMVQHMNEASSNIIDSTGNNHDSDVASGNPVYGATGKIGDSVDFDGAGDYFQIPDATQLDLTTAYTLEAWVKNTEDSAGTGDYPVIISKGGGAEHWMQFIWSGTTPPNGNQWSMNVRADTGTQYNAIGNTDVTDDVWHYTVGRFDSTANTLEMDIDGTNERSVTTSGTGNTNTNKVVVGAYNTAGALPYEGLIDELRISNIARSDGWIETSHDNMNTPQNFFTATVEQLQLPPTTPTDIECNNGSCDITIDTTVNINGTGSTEPQSDTITYNIWASILNNTSFNDITDITKTADGGNVVSVEHLNINIATTQVSNTGTMTKGQDSSKVIPFVTINHDRNLEETFDDRLVDVTISGSTVTCERASSSTTIDVDCSVFLVEYGNNVTVESGSFSMSGNTTTTASPSVNFNDLTDTFMVFTYTTTSTTDNHDSNLVNGEITNTSTMTFERDSFSGNIDGTWYTAETDDESWNVQRGDIVLASTVETNTATITSVDMSKSFVIGSAMSDDITDDWEDSGGSMFLSNSTAVGFERSDGTTSTGVVLTGKYQVVELLGDESVQRGEFTITGLTDTDTITAIDQTETIANIPMVHGTGQGDSTTGADIGQERASIDFQSDTVVRGTVDTDSTQGSWHWEVIEWDITLGNDHNSTATEYLNLGVSDFEYINDIDFIVEVDSYNNTGSLASPVTSDPDLVLEVFDGTSWIDIGNFTLPDTYGDGLSTTNTNFTLTVTDRSILDNWNGTNTANQDFRIFAGYLDHKGSSDVDEIIWTDVWATFNGTRWLDIGNHTEGTNTFVTWNTTNVDAQSSVNVRSRAIDVTGSNEYSAYYYEFSTTPTVDEGLTIQHTIDSTEAFDIPMSWTDVIRVVIVHNKDDPLSWTDDIRMDLSKNQTDPMSWVDSIVATKMVISSHDDPMSWTDFVNATVNKSYNDPMSWTDSITTTVNKSYNDPMSWTDSIVAIKTVTSTHDDPMSWTDFVNATTSKTINDPMSWTDFVNATVNKSYNDKW